MTLNFLTDEEKTARYFSINKCWEYNWNYKENAADWKVTTEIFVKCYEDKRFGELNTYRTSWRKEKWKKTGLPTWQVNRYQNK